METKTMDDEVQSQSGRLYRSVASRILALAQDRKLEVDDRLPGEVELSHHFNVSRATIREALVALEVSGSITMHRNVGAILSGTRPSTRDLRSALVSFDGEPRPREQLEARQSIEPYAAHLAAGRRSESHCQAMSDAIRQMVRENDDGFATERGDRDFHLAIAEASNNALVTSMVKGLWALRENGHLWVALQRHVAVTTWRPKAVFEHMQILEAIRAGDGDTAERAMSDHLASVRASLDEAEF